MAGELKLVLGLYKARISRNVIQAWSDKIFLFILWLWLRTVSASFSVLASLVATGDRYDLRTVPYCTVNTGAGNTIEPCEAS